MWTVCIEVAGKLVPPGLPIVKERAQPASALLIGMLLQLARNQPIIVLVEPGHREEPGGCFLGHPIKPLS